MHKNLVSNYIIKHVLQVCKSLNKIVISVHFTLYNVHICIIKYFYNKYLFYNTSKVYNFWKRGTQFLHCPNINLNLHIYKPSLSRHGADATLHVRLLFR